MKNKDKNHEYTQTCNFCLYRHGGCDEYLIKYSTKECPDFRVGKCYSCVYYKKGLDMTDKETDEWFRRGCECWCPSGCKKYKKNNWFWRKIINTK